MLLVISISIILAIEAYYCLLPLLRCGGWLSSAVHTAGTGERVGAQRIGKMAEGYRK